ncbi:hypothetical protein CALVIDRAFT_540233 [Calocera viscosa TUFC12733]|uniref:Uncharacterized protein n=1 Tax=Calocera viscosa (strain TUFC12733) TaxID=1330018 RepID=A0A167J4Z4_CALVF|nr:hypothetical protein CALVIDRAFT_540233 [Calocera viscosa TUFC12733]
MGVFTWSSPETKPSAYYPIEQPHNERGVVALTTKPKEKLLYTGGYNGSLALWKFNAEKQVVSIVHLRSSHTTRVAAMVCSSHRNWLYSAGKLPGDTSDRVALLDIEVDKTLHCFAGAYPVCQMQEHPNPMYHDVILCESVAIKNQFMLLDHRMKPGGCKFGELVFGDTDRLPVASTKGALWDNLFAKGIGQYTIRVWDLRNSMRFQDVKIAQTGANNTICHLALGPGGIIALRNNEVTFLDWTLKARR